MGVRFFVMRGCIFFQKELRLFQGWLRNLWGGGFNFFLWRGLRLFKRGLIFSGRLRLLWMC